MDDFETELLGIKTEVEQFLTEEETLLAGGSQLRVPWYLFDLMHGLEFADEIKQAWMDAGTQVQQVLQGHSKEVFK